MSPPASEAPVPLSVLAGQAVEHLGGERAQVPDQLLEKLARICSVDTSAEALTLHSRDWWPISLHWALRGQVPSLPAAVVRPSSPAEAAAVLAACNDTGVPLTPAAGRSGVCGGSVPAFGGVVLDCCGLVSPIRVDNDSMLVEAGAGMFGPDLEGQLRDGHGLTVGHRPQSFEISTVGGWLACRGAGQYSTRYGKVEDMVAGLEVALADGRLVATGSLAGAGPRSATGPDLTQLFVGSEGTLGVIVRAELRAHPSPLFESRLAYGFADFAEGLETLRRALRKGATPAVVRLYDSRESERLFGTDTNVLVVLDEGDRSIVEAAMSVLEEECDRSGTPLDIGLVAKWLSERNDVSALGSLTKAGIVVDTIEVSARWSVLPALYSGVLQALRTVEGCILASAHESHAYSDGACLYFSFAGRAPDHERQSKNVPSWTERFYNAAWECVMRECLRHGASISHHHGVGLVRGRFVAEALGAGFDVLSSLKKALDPNGILNPGKMGLVSPFGPVGWPDHPRAELQL